MIKDSNLLLIVFWIQVAVIGLVGIFHIFLAFGDFTYPSGAFIIAFFLLAVAGLTGRTAWTLQKEKSISRPKTVVIMILSLFTVVGIPCGLIILYLLFRRNWEFVVKSQKRGFDFHKGEKIHKEFGIHPYHNIGIYVFLALITILRHWFVFITIPVFVLLELSRRAHKYYITNERVIHHYKFLTKKTTSIFYDRIQDVHCSQNIKERMFGIGKVFLTTAGTGGIDMVLEGIKDPESVKHLIGVNMVKKQK